MKHDFDRKSPKLRGARDVSQSEISDDAISYNNLRVTFKSKGAVSLRM